MIKKLEILFLKKQTVSEAISYSLILNLLSKFFSFIRVIIIAIFIGYTYQTDVFYYAIAILGLFLLFGNVFDTLGIPLLAKHINERENYYDFLFTLTVILSFSLSILNFFLAPYISRYSGFNLESQLILENILKLSSPYIFFSFFFHHFGTLFRFNKQYLFFYFGLFISSSIYTILAFLYFYSTNDVNIYILPISMSIAMAMAAIYGIYLGKKHFNIGFNLFNIKERKKLLYEFVILSFSFAIISLFSIVDKYFASSLEESTVTALSISLFILISIKGLMNFEHILITPISRNYGNAKLISVYLHVILILSILICIYLYSNSDFLINLLLNYGLVDKKNIEITIESFQLLLFILPLQITYATIFKIMQVYSLLKLNFFFLILSILANISLDYILVFNYNYGVNGIIIGMFTAFLILNILTIFVLFKNNIIENIKNNKIYLLYLLLLLPIACSIIFNNIFENYIILFILNSFVYLLIGLFIKKNINKFTKEFLS